MLDERVSSVRTIGGFAPFQVFWRNEACWRATPIHCWNNLNVHFLWFLMYTEIKLSFVDFSETCDNFFNSLQNGWFLVVEEKHLFQSAGNGPSTSTTDIYCLWDLLTMCQVAFYWLKLKVMVSFSFFAMEVWTKSFISMWLQWMQWTKQRISGEEFL